jgi:F0F1-type ATP synthase assembly protein I
MANTSVEIGKIMECNIDARGKVVRMVGGMFSLFAGIVVGVLFGMDIFTTSEWLLIAVILIVSGCFAIFESRAGWCAVRAMGFKTPI